MRTIHIFIFLVLGSLSIRAQETKASVTVTAIGADITEARSLALRSAIEQAFGAYISSNTEILNEELIEDEIISISSGNIDSIHVINETKLLDGRTSISLLAIVSVNKLVSFCENKGYKVEFKGGLFSANLKQQKLNETAELKSIENVCQVGKSIINRSFDFSLAVSEPQKADSDGEELWNIVYNVGVRPNANYNDFKSYLFDNFSKISMSDDEVARYKSLNKEVYTFIWGDPTPVGGRETLREFKFRNVQSLALIQDLFWHSKFSLGFFRIYSNLDTFDIYNLELFPYKSNRRASDENPVWPGKLGFYSTLSENRNDVDDEFFGVSYNGSAMPVLRNDQWYEVNYNLATIYKNRADFVLKEKSYLLDLEKSLLTARDSRDSLSVMDQIGRVRQSLKNFHLDKYIFVNGGDYNGRLESLWAGGFYTGENTKLQIYFGLDNAYEGHFIFSRSFTLSQIESITKVEVQPAGETLGLL
jgi:hypothetical protein